MERTRGRTLFILSFQIGDHIGHILRAEAELFRAHHERTPQGTSTTTAEATETAWGTRTAGTTRSAARPATSGGTGVGRLSQF